MNKNLLRNWWQSVQRYAMQIVYCALLLLTAWLFVFTIVDHDYRQVVQETKSNNDQLVRAFEEHVRRSLHAIEGQMLLIKSEYERAGITPAVSSIKMQAKTNPLLLEILIIDQTGKVVDSANPDGQELHVADRSYFKAHVGPDSQQTFISEPIVGRNTNKYATLLSRRLNLPDGGFAGVVVMALEPAYFSNFYQTMDFKAGKIVRVAGLDGIIRASWTGSEFEIGRDMKRTDLYEKYLKEQRNGGFETSGRLYATPRYFSYRTMPDYPLVVMVGSSIDSALAEYRYRRTLYFTAAAGSSLLIVFFTGLAIFNARRRRQQEERWRLVVEGVNDGIWDWDAASERVFYSDRCKAILGFAPEEISDSREEWRSRSHPDDYERILKALCDHREGRAPTYNEAQRLRCKDGSYRWVRNRGTVIRDDSGQVTRMIGAMTDIHAEKEAAEALRVAELNLNYSREKYQALIEQAFEAVALLDQGKREIVEVNRRFTEWFGYSLPEDAPLYSAKMLTDEKDTQEEYYEKLCAEGALPVERRTYRHKNGSLVFMERSVALIKHRERRLVMITFRNIADQLQHEKTRRQDAAVARRIQRAQIFCPPDSEHVALKTVYHSCSDISGDLYHLEWRNDGQMLRGYLVDVTGHGLTTALYTSTINVLLHEASEMDASLPEQVSWLNRQVCRRFESNSFAAAIAFELDLQARELRYVGAGITRFWTDMSVVSGPMIVRGLYLGIDEAQVYSLQSLPLAVGDRLCFATDGMARLLDETSSCLFDDCRRIEEMLVKLPEKEACQDDATAVCIRIKSMPRGLLEGSWPKILKLNGYDDYRRMKGEVAKVLSEETGKAHSLQEVAVNEAVVNALECRDGNARSQKARIKFNRTGRWLIVRVKTSRIGFAGNATLQRLRANPATMFSFGEDAGMGRGIPMMLSMTDMMMYNSEGTEVLLAWKL